MRDKGVFIERFKGSVLRICKDPFDIAFVDHRFWSTLSMQGLSSGDHLRPTVF